MTTWNSNIDAGGHLLQVGDWVRWADRPTIAGRVSALSRGAVRVHCGLVKYKWIPPTELRKVSPTALTYYRIVGDYE